MKPVVQFPSIFTFCLHMVATLDKITHTPNKMSNYEINSESRIFCYFKTKSQDEKEQ